MMKKIILLLFTALYIVACKKDSVKVAPTITFAANAKTIGDPAYTLTPPVSSSTGAFTYTSSNPAVATINGGQVTIVGVGSTQITATQAAADNYTDATITATLQVVPAGTFVLGQSYQGGIIFYINGTGQHGYMVSPVDLSTASPWSPGDLTLISATANTLGGGAANCTKIINALGNTGTYAAKLCADYRGGGFSDWYLPTTGEMTYIRLNKDIIGGIQPTNYWTSTEVSASPTAPNANYIYMGPASLSTVVNGTTTTTSVVYYTYSKLYTYSVRAIRAF